MSIGVCCHIVRIRRTKTKPPDWAPVRGSTAWSRGNKIDTWTCGESRCYYCKVPPHSILQLRHNSGRDTVTFTTSSCECEGLFGFMCPAIGWRPVQGVAWPEVIDLGSNFTELGLLIWVICQSWKMRVMSTAQKSNASDKTTAREWDAMNYWPMYNFLSQAMANSNLLLDQQCISFPGQLQPFCVTFALMRLPFHTVDGDLLENPNVPKLDV